MKTQKLGTTVKLIGTQRYEIAILKDQDDMYTIAYETVTQSPQYSEAISDYSLASFLFDMKYNELEGQ